MHSEVFIEGRLQLQLQSTTTRVGFGCRVFRKKNKRTFLCNAARKVDRREELFVKHGYGA